MASVDSPPRSQLRRDVYKENCGVNKFMDNSGSDAAQGPYRVHCYRSSRDVALLPVDNFGLRSHRGRVEGALRGV